MKVYLGLGSNLGGRRRHLALGVERLIAAGLRRCRVSPVVESPALLPAGSPSSWNRPYRNLVVEGEVDGTPEHWLDVAKSVEAEAGERGPERWAPRALDVDILLWGDRAARSERLTVPHSDLASRSFVLTPLAHLAPGLRPPLGTAKDGPAPTVLELARRARPPIPLWMAIVNVTPDSFSDGGRYRDRRVLEEDLEAMDSAGVHVLDLGAESTRPGAEAVDPESEWARLEPVLSDLVAAGRGRLLRPLISVDTRHAEVAEWALELGADWINDTSGLADPAMLDLARQSGADWVAMHSLTVPVEPEVRFPDTADPVAEVESWLGERLRAWEAAGLDLDRILFDPGIGFGKSALHSLELLRAVERFQRYGLRILVGHSRKSFLGSLARDSGRGDDAAGRDLETLGISLALCTKGVEVLRVHDAVSHLRAYTAWAHAAA